MPLKVWSHILLVGISVALIVVFIVMRIKGAVYASSSNLLIWTAEVTAWVVMLVIGLLSLRQVCIKENKRWSRRRDSR